MIPILEPTRIVDLSVAGLTVTICGARELIDWAAVHEICLCTSKRDDDLVVAVIGVDDDRAPGGRDKRCLLLAEDDPLWTELRQVLHTVLPMAPIDRVARRLAAESGCEIIYQRPQTPTCQK